MNVPIGTGILDYKNKIAGLQHLVEPTGDLEADMRKITELYTGANAKHPENFSVDLDYVQD